MNDNYRTLWLDQLKRYKQLEQQRKDDIHFLVMVLSLILPATYEEILHDLGSDDYLAIYELQKAINKEKYND